MNEELYNDVKKILVQFEGMPVWEVRLLLKTALEVIEQHSYLNLDRFLFMNFENHQPK